MWRGGCLPKSACFLKLFWKFGPLKLCLSSDHTPVLCLLHLNDTQTFTHLWRWKSLLMSEHPFPSAPLCPSFLFRLRTRLTSPLLFALVKDSDHCKINLPCSTFSSVWVLLCYCWPASYMGSQYATTCQLVSTEESCVLAANYLCVHALPFL